MGKSTPATQTTNATSSTGPWAPSQDVLKGILGQGSNLLPAASQTTPLQQQGINSLGSAAQQAGQYSPDIQSLTQSLFAGGGLGTGAPGIQQAMQTSNAALTPYANGSMLDPTTNPAYAGMLQSLKDQVNNDVGGQFAAAGREFSGAQAGATAKNLTNALAPYLFNQYNQDVQNQFGANAALNFNALNASQGYDAAAGNRLNAQLQAPGSIANSGIPGQMQLAAGGLPLQTSVGNLGTLSNLLIPIAGLGQQGSTSGTQVTTPAQGSLLQQIAGGGLGLLGLGINATGTGGILSGWNPWGTRA